MKTKKKKPWPTKDAMEQVYEMKLWGANNLKFYSGEGSHNPYIINPYIIAVSAFLNSFKSPLSVCDLGCGDFNVGKGLVKYSSKYIAVDIVEDLIDYNRQKYKEDNLEFHCLDIATATLPKADCVLVRQVLQHLSNAEIIEITSKLYDYKYCILTEHIPDDEFTPNKDIISGQGIRLKHKSGVDLLASPFNFKVKSVKELVSVVPSNGKGIIITKLFKVL